MHFASCRTALATLRRRGALRDADYDRYSIISDFFRRQRPTPRPPVPLRVQCHVLRRISLSAFHPYGPRVQAHLFHLTASQKFAEKDSTSKKNPLSPHETEHHPPLEHYPRFFQRLAKSLPSTQLHTLDNFLGVANGFWQRLRVRFKWFTIKSFRKFNADDISAFVTWFLMSQTLWILVGTTTFFSVVFATANSLRLQHSVARVISDYLTSETGVTIIFESAIVPKWKDSRISFKNVYVSWQPKRARKQTIQKHNGHLLAVGYDVSNHPANLRVGEDDEDSNAQGPSNDDGTNWSSYDLTIDSVDVTLSLWRWLDGKGLVENAVVRGVRGALDRRSVYWDPEKPLDPAAFRHEALPGDFHLESLQVEDLLITVYQPGNFRPYTASIFRADIRTFRKRWLFYDFLSAENVVGQVDNCLFSLHKPQSIGRTTEKDLQDGNWARMSRIRIDGVNIDHIKTVTTTEGPFSWITSGKLDAVLDIKFPHDLQKDFNAILGEIADAISTTLSRETEDLQRIPGQRELAKPPLSAPSLPHEEGDDEENLDRENDGPKVVIDIDLRFRDLKAAVPLFTNDLSYINNALVRPIVAFMNANRTLVPIRCRVVKNISEFDGAWTMWETGLMDDIAYKVYDALAYHVSQSAISSRRIRTVGLWSLQKTASAVLSTLRNVLNPGFAQLREAYVNGNLGPGMSLGLVSLLLFLLEVGILGIKSACTSLGIAQFNNPDARLNLAATFGTLTYTAFWTAYVLDIFPTWLSAIRGLMPIDNPGIVGHGFRKLITVLPKMKWIEAIAPMHSIARQH